MTCGLVFKFVGRTTLKTKFVSFMEIILPSIHDIKVQGKRRAPDDTLYNKYADLR